MKTPFQRAQESWEASWVNGPADDPMESFAESLPDTLSDLHDELASVRASGPDEDTPPRLYTQLQSNHEAAIEILEDAIKEREKEVRTAFENLPLYQLFAFSTSDPLEQEILDEVKAEFLEAADEDE